MPTQDFVSPQSIDSPRHEQNMPEGIDTPVPQTWLATRPGDTFKERDSDQDILLGNAGPNIGYALKLARLRIEHLFLLDSEHEHDVEVLLSEIAMRRAARFGRAPVVKDIEFAAHLLGYEQKATSGEEKWRPRLVHGTGHDEHKRRRIVNSIPQEIIEGAELASKEMISGWWEKLEPIIG